MEITMVTGNNGKWQIVRDIFKEYDIEVLREKVETPEIQNKNVENVAKYSAEFARDKLNKIVMKSDVGYYIPELNGFPGPFLKYINEMLESEDILKLIANKKNRQIIMKECVAIAGPNMETKLFVNEEVAYISEKAEGDGTTFDKILIFEGYNHPKSLNTEEDNIKHFEKSLTIYRDIAKFLKEMNY